MTSKIIGNIALDKYEQGEFYASYDYFQKSIQIGQSVLDTINCFLI